MPPIRWSAPCSCPAACRSTRRSAASPAPPSIRILLERLGLKVGDRLSLGTIEVPIRATIEAEPDKLTERLTVGPRVLVSLETLQRTGLIDPGSLVGWRYALKLDDGAGAVGRRARRLPRARQAGAARGRLHRARPARSLAAGVAHARAAAPVPDAGRPHGAAGRRRRRRQCGRHLHRSPAQGDRRLQEPRRHQRA